METTPMFIYKRTSGKAARVFEATEEVLNDFLQSTAAFESQASCDAALMALTNGSDVLSPHDGSLWYRAIPVFLVPTPLYCDLSGQPLGDVVYDAQTRSGGWGILSQQSWEWHSYGKLGTGYGQKYLRSSTGNYYLTEGMSRPPQSYQAVA
jgi:hypothetical protein